MLELTVTGFDQAEEPREEIARLLKEYGVGAVCLLRSGGVVVATHVHPAALWCSDDLNRRIGGRYELQEHRISCLDIIRVWPKDTHLRVTVEVVNA